MREKLHNTLKSISEAPYVAVESPEKIWSLHGSMEVYKMIIEREYDIWESKGGKNFTLKPNDILILSTRVPQRVEDLYVSMMAL